MRTATAPIHPLRGARVVRHRTVVMASLLAAMMALSALNPVAADAKESSRSSRSGVAASTFWTQKDGTKVGTSPFGNTHVGFLNAEQTVRDRVDAWGYIEDYDCKPGQEPGHGGGHGFAEEPKPEKPDNACKPLGTRYLEGSSDLRLTVDKKLNTATLKGTLIAYGGFHGEGEVGRPPANVAWKGVGKTFTSRYSSQWSDGTTTYTDSYRSAARQATMGGRLGPMGFDPALSGGKISQFSSSSSYRAR